MDISSLFDSSGSQIFTCGLLLPHEQEETAIHLCQKIAQNNPHRLKFLLNTVTHPPFVRLYEIVLPAKNISVAIERLERLCENMIRFHMDWGEVERTDHFVAVWGKCNPTLELFQRAVLEALNELREGEFKEKYLEEDQAYELTPEQEKSWQKWGSPWAEPYLPHMIIAKAEPTFEVKKVELEWEFSSCAFRGLFVGLRSGETAKSGETARSEEAAQKSDFAHSLQINFAGKDGGEMSGSKVSPASIMSIV